MPSMRVKQKILQVAAAFRSSVTFCGLLCGSCIASGAVTAQTMTSPPGETTATMRLVAGPRLAAGGYEAGVAITMSAGSHTYWKMPGEAGVPPVFAFNGSENVAAATVLFPVPRRLTEDGFDAFGYTNEVVFPVRVTPRDPATPSVLHADVTYAVCNKICLPEHGTATLTLKPTATVKDATTDLVAAAFAQVPTSATRAQQAMLSVSRFAASGHGDDKSAVHVTAKPGWTLTWHGPGAVEDLFADAPDGFFFTTKKIGDATWTLVADQIVGAATAVPVSLTLRQKTGGLVVMEKLDVATPIQ